MKKYQNAEVNTETTCYSERMQWLAFLTAELANYRSFRDALAELEHYDDPILHKELARRKQFLLEQGIELEELHLE